MSALRGRREACTAVDEVLARATTGHSGVLLLTGEAGIGKTALLEYARGAATRSRFRVASSVGAESEAQFAFAGVHRLCSPWLDRVDTLPDPQRAALDVAFGLRAGAAPDRFLVGLAVLNLAAAAAHDAPVLCLLDDAQWLDRESAQILAFVARRLASEAVVMLFALRLPGDGQPFTGLPELRLHGLADADARALLSAAGNFPHDDTVRERILAEARGNPLALLELPRGPSTGCLGEDFGSTGSGGIARRLENAFARQLEGLPADTRSLLVLAATEPTGEVVLLWHAAAHLGIPAEAAAPAENVGLLEIGTHVRFRHPLARSAVYRAATPSEQRRAHSALAAAATEPDRRAWHRAQSVLGHDEDAADELEQSAGRAGARGGMSASATFLRRAAELTGEPALRAARALAAAHAMRDAGAPESAQELLALAATGPLDTRQRGRLDLLGARIAFELTRGDDVPGMLLDAAAALASVDAGLARESYLHALDAATITGSRGTSRGLLAVVEAARAAPAPPTSPTPSDLLLAGLLTSSRDGYEAGVPGLRAALAAFRDEPTASGDVGDESTRRWSWLAARTAAALYDDETMHLLAHRTVRRAREIGALAELPAALIALSATAALTGELARASELAAEAAAIGEAVGAAPLRNAHLVLAAWTGRRDETAALSAASLQDAAGHELGAEVTLAQYATAVLQNGAGHYPAAQDAATRACRADESANTSLALPELVEAAARTDSPAAVVACEQLEARARAAGTAWALGLAARSRALITVGPAADDAYREAIEHLEGSRMVGYLARTHLVHGEWLRREGHRQSARRELRTAHDQLSEMGAHAFAERAARELRATGEHPRARSARRTDALTAQELHIARMVSTGATSREIATELFLSPRTIEAHLRSIFRKLGITSRRQLKDLGAP